MAESTIAPSLGPPPSFGPTGLGSGTSYVSALGPHKTLRSTAYPSRVSGIDSMFKEKAPKDTFTGSGAESLYTNQARAGQEIYLNHGGMKCAPGGKRHADEEGVPTAYMPTKQGTPPPSDNEENYALSFGAFSAQNNE